jgi:hypothetical protein
VTTKQHYLTLVISTIRRLKITMENKREFSINIGLPSIMLIFVVLCLVSFGVLSLVSANADRKLSKKVLTRQQEYYNASNTAQEMLAEVDNKLHTAYNKATTRDEYMTLISEIPTSYTYEISDIQSLIVTLSYLYPSQADEPLYQITMWKVVTADDLDYDTSLHLIDIEDIE